MAEIARPHLVHYLPLGTTALAIVFCAILLHRGWTRGRRPHLLWWGFGIFAYGLGTALESAITLAGNSFTLNKLWYVAGALFGGYPLAQGTVFLLLKRRTALILTWASLPVVVLLGLLVLFSPVISTQLEPHRPSGNVLAWQWLRLCTPAVNLYAAIFLIGGAVLSSVRYARERVPGSGARALGNALIALGALLPGIGGGMAKAGIVEALYVGEFCGLLLIWSGYRFCVRAG